MPRTRDWQDYITEAAADHLLADLTAIPSPNPGAAPVSAGTGEAAVAAYVADFFRPYSLSIEKQEILDGRWNVLVRAPGRAHSDSAELLFQAHLDTVPADNMPDPFSPRRAHGRLYARGACDTKGSLAAMMLALAALLEADVKLEATVSLLGTADEEYKARGIQAYVASGARPTLAIFGEPTDLQIAIAQRGNMLFDITTHGRAAHASRPDVGLNAIYAMSEVIQKLRDLEKDYASRHHPLCGHPTINVGRIRGGTEAWVVPQECTIAVDRRWTPDEDWFNAWNEIRDAVSFGGLVEVEQPTWRVDEMETAVDELVVRALRGAVENALGYAELVGAPFTSEAPYLVKRGVPAVIFGPGSIAQAHSSDEYVELDQVVQGARILAQFALNCDRSFRNNPLHQDKRA